MLYASKSSSLNSGRNMPFARRMHRLGLLTPSSNTTQEPEFPEVLSRRGSKVIRSAGLEHTQ